MKKNLRIVSAAAAALLAVAPIAASTVSNNVVKADIAINAPAGSSNGGVQQIASTTDMALNFQINATSMKYNKKNPNGQAGTGSAVAYLNTNIDGTNVQTVVNPSDKFSNDNAYIVDKDGHTVDARDLARNTYYHVMAPAVTYNLGLSEAHKTKTLFGNSGVRFIINGKSYKSITVKTEGTGVIRLNNANLISGVEAGTNATDTFGTEKDPKADSKVVVRSGAFLAADPALKGHIAFYNTKNGDRVGGDATLAMNTKEGKTSVQALMRNFGNQYRASWIPSANFGPEINADKYAAYVNPQNTTTINDIAKQLRDQGVTVNPDGSFNVPSKAISLTWTVEGANGQKATMKTNVDFNNKNTESGQPRITVKEGVDAGKVFNGENNEVKVPDKYSHVSVGQDLSGEYANEVKNLFSATVSNGNQTGLPVSVDVKGVDTSYNNNDGKVVVTATNSDGKTSSVYFKVTVGEGNVKPAAKTGEVKVMHNSYIYDKNHNRIGTGKIATYSEVSVYGTATINGKKFYRISSTKDQYIDAENVDGVKRPLKHNAYVYATSKRRANKTVMKKGTEVVTYGSAVKFSNGKYYYRIQGCTAAHKMYIKKANF